MGFWGRIPTAWRVLNGYFEDASRAFMSGDDSPIIDNYRGGDAALTFTAVFACCRVLAETFASTPLHEYRKYSDGTRERTSDTSLYDVLHFAPNEEMSAYALKEQTMYQVNLGGNSVCVKTRNGLGDVVALTPYRWQNVQIRRDSESKRLMYDIQGKTYPRSDVFHVAGPSLDGVIGMSPIEYASKAIQLGLIYESYGISFFKNGAVPSGIFKHPTHVREEKREAFVDDLKFQYSGFKNMGKAMFLEDGLTYEALSMKHSDAELLSSKKFQVEDVARIYRVPAHLINMLDKATFSNIEQLSLEFVMYSMLPHFKRYEECINTQLLTRDQRKAGYFFEFNIAGLLRGDMKAMADAFAIGRQWGWLSVNDIRRMLNMNPIPNGDIYLTPLNMGEAGAKPAMSSASAAEDVARIISGETKGVV